MRRFIEKVRESDIGTRKKWMISCSLACAILVFIIWIYTMKFTMETAVLDNPEKDAVFADTAKAVYAATIGTAKASIQNIFSKFSNGRTIDIMK